jgi:hypothetical protein
MDHSQVLIKTAKGKEEVRTKAFNLSPSLRRLLLLVDGQSTVATTLSRLAALGGDVETELDALLAEGFVAPQESRAALSSDGLRDCARRGEQVPSLQDAPPTGRAPTPPPAFNLEKAKGFARFIVLGYLGPVGAHRVERIDAARSAAQLRAELRDLREILPRLLQKRQAKRVWDQLEPLMLSAGTQVPTWSQGPRRRRPDAVRAGGAPKDAPPLRAWEIDEKIGYDSSQSQLSSRILEFAEPLTDAAIGADATKRAVQMAVICWNAAMLPGNKGLETIAPTLREIAGGDRRLERELFDIFEIMRARKDAQFHGDNRFIVDFALTDTPDGLRLRVASEPLSPDRQGVAAPTG